jgi:flagellar biosynthesis protein FliP
MNIKYLYFYCSEKMYSDMNHASHEQAVAIVVLVMVLTISPVIIILVRHATQTIQVTPWACPGTL